MGLTLSKTNSTQNSSTKLPPSKNKNSSSISSSITSPSSVQLESPVHNQKMHPLKTMETIEFQWAGKAKEVFLTGSFSKWSTQFVMFETQKGKFEITLNLPPGEYEYKYLVDVQGNGWSTRLKILLHMHRVVFIAKREPKDFSFPYLKDMENCVFVKEDMSDLVDKIKLLESDEALYRKIVSGCDKFATTYGSKAFAKDYFIKQVLRYGLKKK